VLLDIPVKPDYEALVRNIRRDGTPARVHYIELFLDAEIQQAIIERFGLAQSLDPGDPWYAQKRQIEMQRFLGYEYVRARVSGSGLFPRERLAAEDTALESQRRGVRSWTNEHRGPIQSWQDFESYPWPDPARADTSELEWYSKNLPDDMCIVSGAHQVFEQVTWLMGYERLCLAVYDQPDLLDAMFQRIGSIHYEFAKVLAQFPRVEIFFAGDDMGFKTQTMIDPRILIDKSICWHARMARLAHDHGKLYLLHSCGNLEAVMPALIEAGIDGRHSFEDAIEPVTAAKKRWGCHMAVLGGIDMDFLARADEGAIRQRVRDTLDVCQPGGGYCLGSGNSVANYIPVENYLTMLDEGRRYRG